MAAERISGSKDQEEKRAKAPKPEKPKPGVNVEQAGPLTNLQRQIGNRAVQRLLAVQRSGGSGSFELDDETTSRINSQRGGGQPLETAFQEQMSQATGQDLSSVKVHTSPESDELNQQLNAKAFTTGSDIFFSQGAYQPGSSSGQELIAHELTHVVQQSTGAVPGGSRMTVNAPGDRFEQEADAVAHNALSNSGNSEVQRQELEEDEMAMREVANPEEEEENVLQQQELDPGEEEEIL